MTKPTYVRLGTPETPLLAWVIQGEIDNDEAPLRPHAHRAMGAMGNTAIRGIIAATAHPFGLAPIYTFGGIALVRGGSVRAIDAVHLHAVDNTSHGRAVRPNMTAEIRTALQDTWDNELQPGFAAAGSGLELQLDETLRSTGALVVPHPADWQPDIMQYVAEPHLITKYRPV